MILSNKLYKISNGKNISLHAVSRSEMEMYLFTDLTRKYKITTSPKLNFDLTKQYYAFNYAQKINNNHLIVGFDNNMSVIDNNE